MGIARRAPRFARLPNTWRAKQSGPASPLGKRDHRSQRQHSFEAPPPGAGFRGIRFPICTDRRSSLTTAISRGWEIGPSKAAAAGDESSASVSASWLSKPLYPGHLLGDASVETESKGAYCAGRRDAPSMQSRGERDSLARADEFALFPFRGADQQIPRAAAISRSEAKKTHMPQLCGRLGRCASENIQLVKFYLIF